MMAGNTKRDPRGVTVVGTANVAYEGSTATPTKADDIPNGGTNPTPGKANGAANGAPKSKGSRRPNYAQIHARKLPLDIYPLPTFQPHNPLSLAPFIYAVIRDFILPRSSHARCPFQASFSSKSRSIHVTNPATVRALWEDGFFGKGTLSRSEPTWLATEKRRLGLLAFETAEEYSIRRRKEREEFKRDRARIEKELVEQLRQRELEGLTGLPGGEAADQIPVLAGTRARELMEARAKASATTEAVPNVTPAAQNSVQDIEVINQEHLQLSLEEAFFLTYALGSLQVNGLDDATDSWDMLQVFRQHSYFPPATISALQPDDPFLLHYVVYHHFRSLGWVVRDGVKFAVDYLLYNRGVVFSHAAFAVLIIPAYSDPYWFADPARKKRVEKERAKRNWHWLHCANRVQNQVLKTLVLVYVDVPSPEHQEEAVETRDVRGFLKTYRVREFCVKRWSPNRNRE